MRAFIPAASRSSFARVSGIIFIVVYAFAASTAAAQNYGPEFGASALLALAEIDDDPIRDRPAMIADANSRAIEIPTARVASTRAEEAELAAQRSHVLQALERFSKIKAVAWPTVREYVWKRCFGEGGEFSAYAYAQPGSERADAFVFTLIIDAGTWDELDGRGRKDLLTTARTRFLAALSELGISGDLQFVLASGLRQTVTKG